ncbi:MAG TPA: ABC transporter substrate-binding protein [Polyangiaceae bacterium]|nr:ABC transporter substrate-binding protein [Polyangiaceae bacterium]
MSRRLIRYARALAVAGALAGAAGCGGGDDGGAGPGGGGGAAGSGGGGSNAACAAEVGGPAVARVDGAGARRCVALASPDCLAVTGDVARDDVVIVGSLLPTRGPDASLGVPAENATRLAAGEIAQVGGLLRADGTSRPLAFVHCDHSSDADVAVRAATHLVDEVGVAAIVGPDFSGLVIDVAERLTLDRGVLLLSPAATSVALTSFDATRGGERLLWRTSPSDAYQAIPLGAQYQAIEAGLKAGGDVAAAKVAVVYKNDAYGRGLYESFRQGAVVNGRSPGDPGNAQSFLAREYDAEGELGPLVAELAAFAPHVVVGVGLTELVTRVVEPLEQAWGAGPRPHYLFSEGARSQDLLDLVGRRDDLRARTRGTSPGTNTPLSQAFYARYRRAHGEALVFGMAGAYDATYLLAYAVVAAGEGAPLTGAALARGLRRMTGGAARVDAGPADVARAFNLLYDGNAIDYNGASGPLDFDAAGEAPSDIQVWCVALDPNTREPYFFDNTGVFYDAAKNEVVGAFACP